MLDWGSITVFFPTPLIFRYYLPLIDYWVSYVKTALPRLRKGGLHDETSDGDAGRPRRFKVVSPRLFVSEQGMQNQQEEDPVNYNSKQ